MIKNELIEEVIYASKNKRFIDKSLLRRIALDEIEQADDIVRLGFDDIRFVNIKINYALALTYKYEGIIEYDYDKVIMNELKENKISSLKANIKMIQCLLHEIEHLNELSKIQEDNFDSKLLKISSCEYIFELIFAFASKKFKNNKKVIKYCDKQYDSFNDKKWEIMPKEKIAELDSYKVLIKSLNDYPSFNQKYSRIYNDIICEYFDNLKMGYFYNPKTEKYSIPLVEFLKALKEFGSNITLEMLGVTEQEYIENFSKLSLENRMRYGFPITRSEMHKVNKQKRLIKGTK